MIMEPDNNGFNIANSLANDMFNEQQREKSYTLTIICDPDEAGIDKKYLEYQRWLVDHHANTGFTKPKRLVINANQNGSQKGSAPALMTPAEDDKFRKNTQTIGKVVFLKDREIEVNSFEKEISRWATHFYMKMHTLCSQKPRFSEMRPVKYNI